MLCLGQQGWQMACPPQQRSTWLLVDHLSTGLQLSKLLVPVAPNLLLRSQADMPQARVDSRGGSCWQRWHVQRRALLGLPSSCALNDYQGRLPRNRTNTLPDTLVHKQVCRGDPSSVSPKRWPSSLHVHPPLLQVLFWTRASRRGIYGRESKVMSILCFSRVFSSWEFQIQPLASKTSQSPSKTN